MPPLDTALSFYLAADLKPLTYSPGMPAHWVGRRVLVPPPAGALGAPRVVVVVQAEQRVVVVVPDEQPVAAAVPAGQRAVVVQA